MKSNLKWAALAGFTVIAGYSLASEDKGTVKAILYQNSDYGGKSLVIRGCRDFNSLRSTNMNDIASSIQVFDGASIRVFVDQNWNNSSLVVDADMASLGAFNDNITSVEILGACLL